MRLLIVRHGDPDYAIDGLTEKGKKEVELLTKRLLKEDIKAVYCSTLGRAKLTAEPFLQSSKINTEYCEWLREFNYSRIRVPYLDRAKVAWDLMPEYVDEFQNIYHPTLWKELDFLKDTEVPNSYDNVCKEFDEVLSRHGYVRDGYSYKAIAPSHDTILFVCHYGLTAVLLSHIMNCSPYSVWQHCFTAPTSVTEIYTEERADGIASFRMSAMGDVSHLFAAGESPSFSGRFCECFTDDTRH